MIKSLITSNKAIILADQALFSGTSFLITILLARNISAEFFGLFSGLVLVLYLVVSLISAFVILPLQVSLSAVDDKKSYLSFSFWFQFVFSGVLVMLFPLLLIIFSNYSKDYGTLGLGTVLYSIGFIFQDYFRKLFLAQGFTAKSLLLDVITSICQFSMLFLALHGKMELNKTLILFGIGYIPAFLYGFSQTKPFYFSKSNWSKYFKNHFNQGKWLFMTSLVQWWAGNLFVISSGLFLGIKALGAFRLVQSLFGVLNILLQTFENYVLPQTSRLMLSSHENAKNYLKNIGIRSAVLFGVLLLLMFSFSNQIILLAGGEKYAEYGYVVKGMAVLYFFIFLGYPIRIAIRSLVLNKFIFMGYVLTLVFSLLSFNYLLLQFQLLGAITGLIVSQLILLTFWNFILVKNKFILWK